MYWPIDSEFWLGLKRAYSFYRPADTTDLSGIYCVHTDTLSETSYLQCCHKSRDTLECGCDVKYGSEEWNHTINEAFLNNQVRTHVYWNNLILVIAIQAEHCVEHRRYHHCQIQQKSNITYEKRVGETYMHLVYGNSITHPFIEGIKSLCPQTDKTPSLHHSLTHSLTPPFIPPLHSSTPY